MNDNEVDETCLLSFTFVLYPKKTTAQVILTNKKISIENDQQKNKTAEIILLDDIIGCHVLEGNRTTGCEWYLCIFSYPMKKKLFKGMVRHRLARSLGVGLSKNINDSKDVAEKWKRVIKYLISGKTLTKAEVDTVPELSPRKYTVYVNPFSGQGKALQMYNGPVRAMLAEAEINHKMIKTEYGGHARKMVKDLNLAECEGIIIVSGDGLVHEVINGLMERTDWEKAIKTPIGIVPGGSGNALAASVIYASTGLHPVPANVTSSVFQICRGRVEDIDIMAIETKSETNPDETVVKYGLLGLVIGIIADIDIESEYLRKLGQVFRTTLYAVMRILCLRTYDITVSYLPVTSKISPVHESVGENLSNGVDVLAAGDQPSALRNHLLPSLNQENLPDNWITETDDFLLLMGANLTHLSQEVMINPDLDLNDGTIRLSKTKSGYSRLDLIRMWGRLEDGIGVVNDLHNVVNSCYAFRIIPNSNHSQILTFDGEKLPFGPLQCQVHHALGRVFCCRK